MISAAIVKTYVDTDLKEEDLARIFDDAVSEIEKRYGKNDSVTEEYFSTGNKRIWLKQPASTITSVKHGPTLKSADLTALTKDADGGFMVVHDGRAVEKLGGEFNFRVQIVYAPKADDARRDRVTIDLCKLALRYNGGQASESIGGGDYSQSFVDYQAEREKILLTLSAGVRAFA